MAETIWLEGETPDKKWAVRVVVDFDKKVKRLEYSAQTSEPPPPPDKPKGDEWDKASTLL